MGDSNPSKRSNVRAAWVRGLVSYGLAGGCFYWIFHDVNWRELWDSLASVNWWWVPPAIILDLATYVSVAWEWHFLLRPVGRLSLSQLCEAVFAGRFANDVLPVHMGYIIRVYLVARWLDAGVAKIVPSLLVERLFDGFWLALAIGFTAFFIPLPKELVRAGEILGAVIIFGAGLTGFLLFRGARSGPKLQCPRSQLPILPADVQKSQPGNRPPGLRWLGKAVAFVSRLVDGIRGIGQSPWLAPAVALSVLKLVLQAMTFLCLLRAYRFELPFWVQLAIFLVACVGIALPSTPASAGVFQVFCIAGLRLFEVPKPVATGFALLAFVLITAPLAVTGFFAFARSGMSLRGLRSKAASLREH